MKVFLPLTTALLVFLTAGVLRADPGKGSTWATGFYFSVTPSFVFPFSVDTTSPGLTPARTGVKWGVGIGGGLGYRFHDFRVEGEVLYGRNEVKDIRFTGGGGEMTGYYDWWGGTINFFYDIPTGIRLRPYVGAGLGAVLFTAHDVTLAGFPPTTGESTLFIYQFMAGASYTLSDAWRLVLGYRFMGMSGPEFETGGMPLYGDPLRTHALQAGVQFYF